MTYMRIERGVLQILQNEPLETVAKSHRVTEQKNNLKIYTSSKCLWLKGMPFSDGNGNQS